MKNTPLRWKAFVKRHFGELLIVLIFLVLSISPLLYLNRFVSFPFPLEFREAAGVFTAVDLSNKLNPYQLEAFPEHLYVYGVLYPLMIAPWLGWITPAIAIPRLINIIFLGLAALTMFGIFRLHKASIVGSLVGSLIFVSAMCVVLKINGARPDISGMFFMLLGVYLVLTTDFSSVGLVLCALCSMIGFYLKQYTILPLLLVSLYLALFRPKTQLAVFALSAFAIGAVSVVIIQTLFPLYFEYSLLHHLQKASYSWKHLVYQFSSFLKYYWIIILLFLYYLHKQYARKAKWKPLIHWRLNSGPPAQGAHIEFVDLSIAVVLVLLIGSLGQHTGNIHIYFQELLIPFLLMAVIPAIDRFIPGGLQRTTVFLLLLLSLIPQAKIYSTDFLAYAEGFRKLEKQLDQCGTIYGSSLITLYLMDRGLLPVYDNGQSGYGWSVIAPQNHPIYGRLWGANSQTLSAKWNAWQASISEKIKNREYDCIAVDNLTNQIANSPLEDYYKKQYTYHNILIWDVIIWVPKEMP